MNTKAFYSLLLVLLVPLICYLIIKQLSNSAVNIPQPVYSDTVISKVVKGKKIDETIWHKIPEFTLTNQEGKKISLKEIVRIDPETGDTVPKIIVANFFFTHCATICPGMTMNIKKIQQSLKKNGRVGDLTADYVQFLSFSVDPERDSVPQLKKWASRFQIDPANWWLLTGDKKTIYDLSLNDMSLWAQDPSGVDTGFFHTDILVLLDKNRVVRMPRDKFGNPIAYNASDEKDIARLSKDIIFLMLEKDQNKKSFFAGKLQLMAIVFLIAIMAVATLVYFLKKKKD